MGRERVAAVKLDLIRVASNPTGMERIARQAAMETGRGPDRREVNTALV